MELKIDLDTAKQMALDYMKKGYHCGPAVLQVMWEAYDLKDENYLWAGIPFMGGISGENLATCGAVSGFALSLALRHKTSLAPENKKNAKAARNIIRSQSAQVMKEFVEKFGHVTCQELLEIDFSKPGAYQEFKSSGLAEKKCYAYVYFLIEKLYELENQAAG